MRLLFAVALGGSAGNEALEGTPLVDDGFMYISDHWGVVYKIDVRDGKAGRIVWKMDPGQEKLDRNRGVALWNNLVISVTSIDCARDRDRQGDRQGRVGQESARPAGHVHHRGAARAQGRRSSSAPPAATAACATGSPRSTPRPATSSGRPIRFRRPGEPGSETWKDKNNAWQTGGGAFYVTGSYDPRHQPHLLGLRQSGAGLRCAAPARRQSLYVERDRVRCRERQDFVVAPVHAERQPRLRRDRHAHPDRHQGQRRGPQDRLARRPQRLQVHVRPPQRPVPQGRAVRQGGDLDQGHRSQDRQAGRLRSEQGLPGLCRRRRRQCRQARAPRLPRHGRRQQLLAGVLQPEDQADLHPGATKAAPTSRPTTPRTCGQVRRRHHRQTPAASPRASSRSIRSPAR